MKLYTIEQLSDCLSQEIVWRKKELSTLKRLIESSRRHKDQQNALIRSGITVLYAHWEGFVKAASSAYLQFVAMQRLSYERLTANFVALGMKDRLEAAKSSNKASVFVGVAQAFLTGLSERCPIPYKRAVETNSNLSSAVFREIICLLNLDYGPYSTKEKILDQTLLNSRNHIAHGEYLDIDVDTYVELQQEVIPLMDLLRNQIENAAITAAYRRR